MMPRQLGPSTHAVGAGDFHHFAFQRGANVAAFGKAGGDDDDVLDATAAALFDDLWHRLRAGGDHRHFYARADFLDRLVGRLVLDGLMLGVDGV